MATDRWFLLVEDKLDDIPARITQLKSSFWLRIWAFLIMTGVGILILSLADNIRMVAIGGLMAGTGVAGIMTISLMAYTQLCLYRSIIEMRKLNGKQLS